MEKLVSIVLPVYNGEKYLEESIESVLNQTYWNWELLIVDDCSTDNTEQIAKRYQLKDSRVQYYKNEKNLRLPRNLNKGFSMANGEFLTWTSDDNMYKPDAIKKMVNCLEKTKADFVYTTFDIIDEDGRVTGVHEADEENMKKIVGENTVGACFMYTRKVYETVGEYNHEFMLVEDFDYWQRIFSKFKVSRLMDNLYSYRYHGQQLTSTMKKEQFYTAKKKMLINNRKLFRKLSLRQKYYYYKALNECLTELEEENKYYRYMYMLLSLVYYVEYVIPRNIRCKLHGLKKRIAR